MAESSLKIFMITAKSKITILLTCLCLALTWTSRMKTILSWHFKPPANWISPEIMTQNKKLLKNLSLIILEFIDLLVYQSTYNYMNGPRTMRFVFCFRFLHTFTSMSENMLCLDWVWMGVYSNVPHMSWSS